MRNSCICMRAVKVRNWNRHALKQSLLSFLVLVILAGGIQAKPFTESVAIQMESDWHTTNVISESAFQLNVNLSPQNGQLILEITAEGYPETGQIYLGEVLVSDSDGNPVARLTIRLIDGIPQVDIIQGL